MELFKVPSPQELLESIDERLFYQPTTGNHVYNGQAFHLQSIFFIRIQSISPLFESLDHLILRRSFLG